MERRDFLKLALGLAGAVAVAGAVTPSEAAPAMAPLDPRPDNRAAAEPAIATDKDLDAAAAEPVQWRRRRWRRWGVRRRRYWGWRPRRYWGWRRRRVIYFY